MGLVRMSFNQILVRDKKKKLYDVCSEGKQWAECATMSPAFNTGLSSLTLLIGVMSFSEFLLFLLVSESAVSFLA